MPNKKVLKNWNTVKIYVPEEMLYKNSRNTVELNLRTLTDKTKVPRKKLNKPSIQLLTDKKINDVYVVGGLNDAIIQNTKLLFDIIKK